MNSAVLFIIFNRPDTTVKVFAAIREARPKRLYIAADGPRGDREDEADRCAEARKIAANVDWPCEVQTLFREKNLGCRRAVSGAITWFFEHEDEGIILEDDCLPHPSFFLYCSELLERYRDDERVMLICGDNTLNSEPRWRGSYDFSNHALIWGWASWARAWAKYDLDRFRTADHVGVASQFFPGKQMQMHWVRQLSKVADGTIDTWDYQWAFTVLQHKGLAAVPSRNLISNIGFGDGATHTKVPGGTRDARSVGALELPLVHPPVDANLELNSLILRDIHSISPPAAFHVRAFRKLSRVARASLRQMRG